MNAGFSFSLLGLCQCIPNSAWMSGSLSTLATAGGTWLNCVALGRPLSLRMALAV